MVPAAPPVRGHVRWQSSCNDSQTAECTQVPFQKGLLTIHTSPQHHLMWCFYSTLCCLQMLQCDKCDNASVTAAE